MFRVEVRGFRVEGRGLLGGSGALSKQVNNGGNWGDKLA